MMRNRNIRGYTLLEMIVAVGIFSVVMLIVTGAYLTLIGLDRELRASTSLVTNLSFALDSMSRSIRTGNAYGCGSSGGDPVNPYEGDNAVCTSFSYFDVSLNSKVTYVLKTNGIIGRCTGTGICNNANAISLTDPNITVASLTFYVRGVGTTGAEADIQPQVTFTMQGTMKGDPAHTQTFSIQTSATQRLIEI